MAGRPSARLVEAMKLVMAGTTPYQAAQRLQIATTTMYKSRLYKMWLAGDHVEVRKQLDVTRAIPRIKKTSTKVA